MKTILLFFLSTALLLAGEPSGDSVWVQGREPLTHAKVKKVLPDGILFIADQGLVKARFDQLAPEWAAAYGEDADRAAAKAETVKVETAAAINARSAAARPPERITGRVVAKRHGSVLVISCEEKPERFATYEEEQLQASILRAKAERPKSEYSLTVAPDAPEPTYTAVEGIVALKDAALYLKLQSQDRVNVVVRRCPEDVEIDGLDTPLYTVIQ